MNAILGVTELLIQNEKIPADAEEGLDKIYSSCDLLLGIINDILDFSKIEAGKLDIIPVQYKIASMINDSVHLNMMRINSKPIEFELIIDENIPATLTGDDLRIKQILNNLLSNAFKYTDSGKVTLTVELELPEEKSISDEISDDKQIVLVLSVRDTGHGMTPEQLGQLFEEYSRFNQNAKIAVEGTGLGLAITQRLINLMDGKITVDSERGKGSLFTIYLPQIKVDDEILGSDVAENLLNFRTSFKTRRKSSQIVRDPMPYGKVLIVDDVETNIYVAEGLIRLYRIQIDTAMSGQEAIDKINEGNVYDVIFMDHMMPEMDGIEAVKILRDSGYSAPIIALTANAVYGQADMFLQNGFDDFISKPIDIRQLNSVLNRYVRDKQPFEVIEAARRQNVSGSIIEANESGANQVDPMLLKSFIRDAKKAVLWLEENSSKISNKDVIQRFTVLVHGMKSSLWNIGEMEIAGLAGNLEKGGKEQDIDLITAAAPAFITNLRILLKKLESEQVEDNEYLESNNEDKNDLRNKLLVFLEKADDYDRKGALNILAEIKNYSKETKEVLDLITEHVLHSHFEDAAEAVKKYLAVLDK